MLVDSPNQMQYSNAIPKTCLQRLFNWRLPYTELRDRSIISNVADVQLQDNGIETSKYNLITFIPLNLIFQFTKPSNIYFLVIAILQMVPAISVSDGKPTMMLPLSFVVFLSMIKDFVEDWKRRKNDQRENGESVLILKSTGYVKLTWKEIRVGDIIKINRDQYFPCDILVLKHDANHKQIHIQTKNLDGETNLKIKSIPKVIRDHIPENTSDEEMYSLRMRVNFQKPNPFLNTFNGNAQISNQTCILDINNLALRGCSLKINEYAVGLCLYNGHQSKIMLNAGKPTPKVSRLQTCLNEYFKFVIGFLIVVTLAIAITYGILLTKHPQIRAYIQQNESNAVAAILTWGSWFISFSNFIPISLLVSLEMVRWGQGYFLGKDKECVSRGVGVEAQTSSVNEELGQVEYVLSDKTGTLTQNVMSFKCFYIDGMSYGDPDQANEEHSFHANDHILPHLAQNDHNENAGSDEMITHDRFSVYSKQELIKDLLRSDRHALKVRQALRHLALCHSVVLQGSKYSSASSDEMALVEFAKFIGFEFVEKNLDDEMIIHVTIPQIQQIIKARLVHVLQFSSQRKRMSVIVEIQERGTKPEERGAKPEERGAKPEERGTKRLFLLSKGADDVMLKRLAKKDGSQHAMSHLQTQEINAYLNRYSSRGLRTMVLASRQLTYAEYEKWNGIYKMSLTSLSQDRQKAIQDLQSQLQKNMDFIGITAIEDQLQLDVKYTIEALQRSDIKVWMLTGDKMETAEAIGLACGLMDERTFKISLNNREQSEMAEYLQQMNKQAEDRYQKIVIIFKGEFFNTINESFKPAFEKLLKKATNVICCRVSPKDKEEITHLVKEWGVVLAVGDGANDVNMINSAHVGVGVRGIQGSQATRAADYVIGEFRILNRLVLFHGFNFYHRNANLILYIIFKNILVAMPILLYGSLSMQSAHFIYDNWTFQFYNVLFVFFPIMYFGLFDVVCPWKKMLEKPSMYKLGQKCKYFNRGMLAKMFISVIIYASMLIFILYYSGQNINAHGKIPYQEWIGMQILGIVVVACNLRIFFISNQINAIQCILIFFGIGSFFFCFYFISLIMKTSYINTLKHELADPNYWIMMLFFAVFINTAEIIMDGLARMGNLIQEKKAVRLGEAKNAHYSSYQDCPDRKYKPMEIAKDHAINNEE